MNMGGVDSWYSWVVAFAGCVIFLLVSCPVRLGAQLYVSLLDRYDTNRKEASFPFALALVVRSLSGPFAGVLGEIIGLQGVSILGCVISAVGVGGCFFAEDVATINICFGVIYGIGYGWSNALVPEILNLHFKKHRNKAYGVFLSGGGLGSFIAPPILELLLNEFGISGTFLIMGAIVLNAAPAAMLLTVPKKEIKIVKPSMPLSANATSFKVDDQSGNSSGAFPSYVAVNGCKKSVEEKSENVFKTDDLPFELRPTTQYDNDIFEIQLHNGKNKRAMENHEDETNNSYKEIAMNKRLKEGGSKHSFYELKEKMKLRNGQFNPFKKSLFSQISVLWSPEFLALALIQGINAYINQVLWTITVDFARDKRVEQHLEIYFVMSLSLFDTIGRFLLGIVPDKGLITIRNFSFCCFSVIGVICVSLTWLPEFYSLMTAYVLLGLVIGGCTIAIPALITEFIEEEKRSTAMASRLLATAPLCLTISPLIGLFRGSLGSYDGLLYLMASMCFICTVLLLILPLLAERRDRLRSKENF